MAALNIEVTSKRLIKPSSPTPSHLKIRQLSFLDQLATSVHTPMILFYQNLSRLTTLKHDQNLTKVLITSLADTLVQFYPLAGRIQGGTVIDCNDEGVEFYETRVSADLSAVIEDPKPDELVKLLPYAPSGATVNNLTLLAGVQVNQFSCGGVAVGVCMSHKFGDGFTLASFFNAWAAMARGLVIEPPLTTTTCQGAELVPATLFPPRDFSTKNMSVTHDENKVVVTRRLVFDKDQISALRKQAVAAGSQFMKAPSRSVLVCAFIWKRFVEGAKAKPHPPRVFGARQTVNLRTIPGSPVQENCLGNMYTFSSVASHYLTEQDQENLDDRDEYVQLIRKLQESTKHVDLSYFQRLQNGENLKALPKEYVDNAESGDVELCGFSSCVWFPFYAADFGWGEPVWVSMASLDIRNTVILLPTKCREGIEAWVYMDQDYVPLFDRDLLISKWILAMNH